MATQLVKCTTAPKLPYRLEGKKDLRTEFWSEPGRSLTAGPRQVPSPPRASAAPSTGAEAPHLLPRGSCESALEVKAL